MVSAIACAVGTSQESTGFVVSSAMNVPGLRKVTKCFSIVSIHFSAGRWSPSTGHRQAAAQPYFHLIGQRSRFLVLGGLRRIQFPFEIRDVVLKAFAVVIIQGPSAHDLWC